MQLSLKIDSFILTTQKGNIEKKKGRTVLLGILGNCRHFLALHYIIIYFLIWFHAYMVFWGACIAAHEECMEEVFFELSLDAHDDDDDDDNGGSVCITSRYQIKICNASLHPFKQKCLWNKYAKLNRYVSSTWRM